MSFTIFLLLLFSPWQAAVVPYKPSDEFQLDIDFKFKQLPVNDPSVLNFQETKQEHDKKQYASGPLPYLFINCKILKLGAGEVTAMVASKSALVAFIFTAMPMSWIISPASGPTR